MRSGPGGSAQRRQELRRSGWARLQAEAGSQWPALRRSKWVVLGHTFVPDFPNFVPNGFTCRAERGKRLPSRGGARVQSTHNLTHNRPFLAPQMSSAFVAPKIWHTFPPFFTLQPTDSTRATQLEEFVPGQLHALCQPFALPGADIRLRCVVARLPAIGGLLLVSPVAPTPECLDLLAGLARGGQVEHIVLPSASPEHW